MYTNLLYLLFKTKIFDVIKRIYIYTYDFNFFLKLNKSNKIFSNEIYNEEYLNF